MLTLKKLRKAHLLVVGAVFVLVVILVLCYWFFVPGTKAQAVNSPVTVTVKALSLQALPLTMTTFGQVVSPVSVSLMAQTSGVISEIHFKPGESVKKGQPLFILQSNDTSAQLNQLKAQAEYAKEYYVRNQQLQKNDPGAISEIDVLQAYSNYQQALSQYEAVKTIHTIVAPIDGVMSDTDLAPGDFVNAGQILASLVSPYEQIKYTLPSQVAAQSKIGQQVTFMPAEGEQSYTGTVVYVSPLLSNQDYSITLRADISSAKAPILNTFGQVIQVLDPTHQVLAVPQSLVQNDAQGFYVYILKGQQVAKQYFQPGEVTQNGLMVVKSGLTTKLMLITSDPSVLSENETVQVVAS